MSAFDSQINVIDIDVAIPEDVPEGDPIPFAQVSLVVGHLVPMMTPQGPQGAVVPLGVLRFQIDDQEKAQDAAVALAEAAERLPAKAKPSGLSIASSMSDVEQARQSIQGLIQP